MQNTYHLEFVGHSDAAGRREAADFLRAFGLSFDEDVEFTVALRDQDGRMAGTGSFAGEVLRNIAVDESIQGEGLTSGILSALMQELARRGVLHYFIFTKPDKAFLFANLGFAEIARAEPYAALLESGLGSVASYCEAVAAEAAHLPAKRAAIVVNANPFTRGHQALVRKAASENGGVIVFVVREDRSLFPFADRLRLVREGTADLGNVAVVSGGKYIISAATFPTYFTREEDKVAAQAHLDIDLFASRIAPRLGIAARYVGEEPYCPVTRAYNQAMLDILPERGVEVRVMPRVAARGEAVSASKVRGLIREGRMENLGELVPDATLAYLLAGENEGILERIRASCSRH